MQMNQVKERLGRVEQCASEAMQACQSSSHVPQELQSCLSELDRRSHEAMQMMQGSQDEQRIVQCVDDLERLVLVALTAPDVGHSIVYGMSDNGTRWWDNRLASHIGYRPQDSSEPWRAELEARQPTFDPQDPTRLYHGGVFVQLGPYD